MKQKRTQKRSGSVTMRAIAEEAGVTLTTVSRILNDKGDKYAEGTKAKIFEIADRLKYRPNALVRGMQTGSTRTAGVLLPGDSWFYSQIIGGIQEVFFENDTIMLLVWNPLAPDTRDAAHEQGIIHQLVDRRVDGVILRPTAEDFERSYFEEIWERNIPLILVDREMSNVSTDFVGTDDVAGGRAAAEYLVDLGHRRLLFVGPSKSVSTSRHREEGFRQVLSETPNASCRAVNGNTIDPAVLEILRSENRPTAIFCYNDDTVHRIIDPVREAGLSIPGDISLLGFGNKPVGRQHIPITTFDQDPHRIGRTAAGMYIDRVYDKKKNNMRHEMIDVKIVVRASTAAPAGS